MWNGACYISFLLSQLSPPCPFFCQTCGCSPIFSQHQWISGKNFTGNHGFKPYGFSLKKNPWHPWNPMDKSYHKSSFWTKTSGQFSILQRNPGQLFCLVVSTNAKKLCFFHLFFADEISIYMANLKNILPKDSFEECFSWLGSIYIHLSSFIPIYGNQWKIETTLSKNGFFAECFKGSYPLVI